MKMECVYYRDEKRDPVISFRIILYSGYELWSMCNCLIVSRTDPDDDYAHEIIHIFKGDFTHAIWNHIRLSRGLE